MYKAKKPIALYFLNGDFKCYLKEAVKDNNEYYKYIMRFTRNKYNPLEIVLNDEKFIIKHINF